MNAVQVEVDGDRSVITLTPMGRVQDWGDVLAMSDEVDFVGLVDGLGEYRYLYLVTTMGGSVHYVTTGTGDAK